jgi:outer membrane protein
MKTILTILLIGSSFCLSAQSFWSVQYSVGFGSGDVKDFIEPTSFRGTTLEYRQFISDNVALGFEIGWNVFYERKSYDSYTLDNQTLSGVQYRYLNMVPINLAAGYYFKPGETINPFVGLGIGTLFSRRNVDMNLYTIETDTWHFQLRPEVGILFNARPGLDFILAGKYYAGFKTEETESENYFGLNFGVVFTR